MIKVLKKGKINKTPQYKQTCRKCACTFEADQEDIKAEDRPCSQPYFDCPTCLKPVNAELHPDWKF